MYDDNDEVETCPRCGRETVYGLVTNLDLPTDEYVCVECRAEYASIDKDVRDAYEEVIHEETDERWLDGWVV